MAFGQLHELEASAIGVHVKHGQLRDDALHDLLADLRGANNGN